MSADGRLPRSPGPALRDEYVAPDWSGDRPAYPLLDLVTDGRSLASLLEMAARGTLKLSCDLDALTPPPSHWLVWNAAPMLLSDGTTAEACKWGRVCSWAPTSGLAAIYTVDRSWRLVAADRQPTVRVVHCRPPRGFTLEDSEPHPLLPLGEIAPASPVTWADLGLTGIVNPDRGPGAPVAVQDLWVQHDDAVAAGLLTTSLDPREERIGQYAERRFGHPSTWSRKESKFAEAIAADDNANEGWGFDRIRKALAAYRNMRLGRVPNRTKPAHQPPKTGPR